MNDILDFMRDGIKVNVYFDTESAIILGVILFTSLTLVAAFYAKILR